MIEKEIRGYIDNSEFENKLDQFVDKFGDYKHKKRMAMVMGDFHDYDVEIRIRITNGKQEITYKIGDQNALNRQEISTNLITDSQNYLNLFRSFKLLSQKSFKDPYYMAIQHDNYLFHTPQFEIKLFKQFNDKDHFCGFEVEQHSETEIDIYEYTKSLGLVFAKDYNTREVVRERNVKYNIDLTDYDDKQLINLIGKYLNHEDK